MGTLPLMLGVTACYTISSLSDKYAVAKAKFSKDEFTFLMCCSMSVFIALTLPFQRIYFSLTWQSFVGIALIAVCKMLEFQLSAVILKELSAFELKAWLGLTLFVSYFSDVFWGAQLQISKLLCICAAVSGLVMIAKSEKEEKINYRAIAIPLIFYLASKFGYGLVIRSFESYASSVMLLVPALIAVTLIFLPRVKFSVFAEKSVGTAKVVLARIPNSAGMIMENAVISISLTDYSFIQPMILVSLFVIGLIRRECCSRLNLIGSIVCVAAIAAFQIL